MTRRLGRAALALYPLAFRRRYEAEMQALLDQGAVGPAALVDLLRGAAAAHVRPPAGLAGSVDRDDRLRASAIGVLACWVLFAAAGAGFYKSTEDLAAAGDAHRVLGVAHGAVQALALLGSVAVLAGALPLIVSALRHARLRRRLLRLVAVPVAAVAGFACATALLVAVARTSSHHADTAGRAAFAVWALGGLACAGVLVVAARRTLLAMPASRARLVGALACGSIVTAAMAAMTLGVAVYAIALAFDASRVAGEPDGPLGGPSTGVALVAQLVMMVVAVALCVTTTRRGWRALRGPSVEPRPTQPS